MPGQSTSSARSWLISLGGAALALGAMALSLLPGVPALSLRVGILLLLATPWVGVAVLGWQGAATGTWRRAGLAAVLMTLAAGALL